MSDEIKMTLSPVELMQFIRKRQPKKGEKLYWFVAITQPCITETSRTATMMSGYLRVSRKQALTVVKKLYFMIAKSDYREELQFDKANALKVLVNVDDYGDTIFIGSLI
jgi:hypothetical protein